MTLAYSFAVRDPEQCLRGYIEARRRLIEDLNIGIVHVLHYPPGDVGDWDSVTRTLQIRKSAHIEDQIWIMQQVWTLLSIGAWAADAAIPQPILTLVPPISEDDPDQLVTSG